MNTLASKPRSIFLRTTLAQAGWARIHLPFVLLAVVLGAMHTWAAVTRHSMNPDGVSYLDIGDAYFRGDWDMAINSVWPPLYAWLLGLVNWIFKPSMQWEFPTVHLVNFVIYLGALASFVYLWRGLRASSGDEPAGAARLPQWLWWAIGYSLFIWTALSLIQMWSVTPDMLVAAIVCLAAGLIARLQISPRGWGTYALLGLLLGIGYLAKAFMFSMAFVFLAAALLIRPVTMRTITRTVLALGIFLMVSMPYVEIISQKAGKFTIGESGTVTYLRYVGGVPFPHWQGDPQRGILPDHPSRLMLADPPVYEFGTPVRGTYPISADPSYWYAGLDVPFNLQNQLLRIFDAGMYYLQLFGQRHGIFTAAVLALLILSFASKSTAVLPLRRWALVLPALAGLGLYALVLVADRYVGVFVLLLWASLLPHIRLPDVPPNRIVLNVLGGIAVAGLLLNIGLFNLDGIGRLNPPINSAAREAPPPTWPGEVALELQRAGIQPGDRVGVIGYAYDSFWARLAKVTIAAEMIDQDAGAFWTDAAIQAHVLDAFDRAGVQAVVAEYAPHYARLDGWQQVGESNYFVYFFLP